MKVILLVEDEVVLRSLMARALCLSGYTVVQAVDGREAINILNTKDVDLILSDIMMPNLDGFELIKHVKGSDKHKKLPFVFITARVSKQEELYGLDLGANAFLKKPIDINECIKCISSLVA